MKKGGNRDIDNTGRYRQIIERVDRWMDGWIKIHRHTDKR